MTASTVVDAPSLHHPPEEAQSQTSHFDWRVAAAAVAIIVWGALVSPNAVVPSWSYRTAMLPAAIALGLPVVVVALRSKHRVAAFGAIGFVVASGISSLLSANPDLSATGRYGVAGGLVFAAALAAAWGIGLAASHKASTIVRTIGAIVGLNAVIGVVQVLTAPSIPAFELVNGRAAAMLGNPVHLAGLLTAGLALFAFSVQRWTIGAYAAAAALAFSIQSTGTRLTLVIVPLVAVAAWFKLGAKRGTLLAVSIILATGAGVVVLDTAETANSVERLATTVGEADERIETWRAAGQAIQERPVLGWGPGLFLDATAPRQSQALAAATPDSTLFVDGHNLAIEYAVTTGVIGVVALALFLGAAVMRARGSLLAFALVLLAFHAIQPQSSSTTPLLFLALGAAAFGPDVLRPRPSLQLAALSIAVLVGGAFLVGDAAYSAATADWLIGDVETANAIFPQWPEPASQGARIKLYESVAQRTPGADEDAVMWLGLATAADPADPGSWNELGFAQGALGRIGDAKKSFIRALESDPWSVQALVSLSDIALIEGDPVTARQWAERAASVSTSEQVEQLLDRVAAAESR